MNLDIKKKTAKRKAQVLRSDCVACGSCINVCPLGAIKIVAGVFAKVDEAKCVGCSRCVRECPASVIEIVNRGEV